MERGMKSTELVKETIFRLAHFNPSAQDDYGNQLLDYFVLDSLATGGGPLLKISAEQINADLKRRFHLDFEVPEIINAGKRLAGRKMITLSGIEQTKLEKGIVPQFQILPDIYEKINRNINIIKELEDETIISWKNEICERYNDYPIVKQNINLIEEKLHSFTSKMFMQHGVECVALLYQDNPKAQQWLMKISVPILDDLFKTSSIIDEIAKVEIPRFFKTIDNKRIRYINSLFNASFFWHTIQIDEKCSRLLREVVKGQKLLLDNNILYSLIGLHGAKPMKSVHHILRMAQELGYELLVTTKTIDEFNESLRIRIKENKPIPKELARIAIQNLECDNFMVCYWKEFVDNGISIEEFVAEKSHIEEILNNLKINITHKIRKDIESSQELLKEESLLRQVAPPNTDEHVIEHDAFHRLLIQKMRRGEKYNFSEADVWFLTHDTKLPVYDRIARKGRQSLPFCLLTNQWVQINRPLLARISDKNDLEESYNSLVTQPYLRAMLSSFPIERAYNEVLGRLARYKNIPTQLVLRIVTDTHFAVTIAQETNETVIVEKIDNKIVDLYSQLFKEKEKLIVDKNELEKRISNIEKELSDSKNLFEELKVKLKEEKEKRECAENEAKKKDEELKTYKKEREKEKLLNSAKIRLGIILAIFLLLEILVCFLAIKYGAGENAWQKLISSWGFLTLPLVVTVPIGWFYLGKQRLSAIGWPWNKIFKINPNNEAL